MVHLISKCMVKAKPPPKLPADQKCHLATWDLTMLSCNYIQKGHLFPNLPPTLSIANIIHNLTTSLSVALHHFYPLAGRFATQHELDSDGKVTGMFVFIDCNNEGVEFVHAEAKSISVGDVLSPSSDVPNFIQSFFQLDGASNYDAHSFPLLAVQLTVLADAKPPLKIPFSHESEFLDRFSPPPLREKMFHFTSEAIAKLKAKANKESGTNNISSYQSISALIWRCISRARRLPADKLTTCRVSIQNRARLQPPLSPNYFGNSINVLCMTATAGELLGNGIGWAAWKIHEAVVAHKDDVIRGTVRNWMELPVFYKLSLVDESTVAISSSPRFDMYGCEFGWGKAVALRSGSANKVDGKVMYYPGWEGGGSIDLEVCLLPEFMTALESDPEFKEVVSPGVPQHVHLSN
ncbi:putative shikimate O-hydroxycinnamoyltransferase [Dioscorea sansibarensis]